jgi:hypothetical protein
METFYPSTLVKGKYARREETKHSTLNSWDSIPNKKGHYELPLQHNMLY